jgi:hypothetical protein
MFFCFLCQTKTPLFTAELSLETPAKLDEIALRGEAIRRGVGESYDEAVAASPVAVLRPRGSPQEARSRVLRGSHYLIDSTSFANIAG